MRPEFRIVSGRRAGFIFTPREDEVFIAGRNADAALRFDPETELTVSGRHAEFIEFGDTWHVRDLHSRNGTFVNGQRLMGQRALADGDTVMLGPGGPRIEFRRVGTVSAPVPRESTTQRLRAAVRNEVRRVRVVATGVVALLLVVVAGVVVDKRNDEAAREGERRGLQARIDSLLALGRTTESTLQGEVTGLRDALRESEQRLRDLRAELDAAGDRSQAAALERELLAAGTALRRQQLAASLDFPLIERRNRAAVAMVWVEYTDGGRVSGTAFAVRQDGTLITNRHLVAGADGSKEPARIAIRFADSDQTFPGRLLTASSATDLAAIRVENILGSVPIVYRMNARADTLAAGAPVALIGFPLGGVAGSGLRAVARPLVSAGVVVSSSADRLDVQGMGAEGSSGSPMLDADGQLIGVLFGGRSEAGVQVLVGVPAGAVADLLATLR